MVFESHIEWFSVLCSIFMELVCSFSFPFLSGFYCVLGLIVGEREGIVADEYFQVIGLFVGISWVLTSLSSFIYGCLHFMK